MTPTEMRQTDAWLLSSAVVSSTFAIAIGIMAVMGALTPTKMPPKTAIANVAPTELSSAIKYATASPARPNPSPAREGELND